MAKMSWREKVNVFVVNPESAKVSDIVRLAEEWQEMSWALLQQKRAERYTAAAQKTLEKV